VKYDEVSFVVVSVNVTIVDFDLILKHTEISKMSQGGKTFGRESEI
jgi:hypothetical protein